MSPDESTPVLIVSTSSDVPIGRLSSSPLPQIGAGPAGLVAALTLLENGIRPRIIDKARTFHRSSRGVGLQVRAQCVREIALLAPPSSPHIPNPAQAACTEEQCR